MTLDIAEEVLSDFEDLVDTEFSINGNSYIVDAIVISPAAQPGKDAFAESWLRDKNGQNYSGDDCDVLLMVTDTSGSEAASYISIETFITEKGISYNFPS